MAQTFLAVAGSIGSGKTTLTRRLAGKLGFTALFENTEDNPYLSDFYGDMHRYALPLQARFLATRVRQTRDTQRADISAIQDRTCYEDAEIFAAHLHGRGDMDDRDFETYRMLAEPLLDGLKPPSLLVYLDRSAKDCFRQIRERGRDYEQTMPTDYLGELVARYKAWFESYDRGPKLRVFAEEHDFLNEDDLEKLTRQISANLPQLQLPF